MNKIGYFDDFKIQSIVIFLNDPSIPKGIVSLHESGFTFLDKSALTVSSLLNQSEFSTNTRYQLSIIEKKLYQVKSILR